MEGWPLLTSNQQQELFEFMSTFPYDTGSDMSELEVQWVKRKWVRMALEVVAHTWLTNVQKKALVAALYHQVVPYQYHAFKEAFHVMNAIECMWDTFYWLPPSVSTAA